MSNDNGVICVCPLLVNNDFNPFMCITTGDGENDSGGEKASLVAAVRGSSARSERPPSALHVVGCSAKLPLLVARCASQWESDFRKGFAGVGTGQLTLRKFSPPHTDLFFSNPSSFVKAF